MNIICSILFSLTCLCSKPFLPPYGDQDILLQINVQRAQQNLPAVTENQDLMDASSAKAEDMWTRDYWAHSLPGEDAWQFIRQTPYDWQGVGEVLAEGWPTATATVNAWMDSPTHKKILLTKDYRDIGINVDCQFVKDKRVCLVVVDFGYTRSE